MSADRPWFELRGYCSGCNRPAVYERFSDRIVTLLADQEPYAEHDSEACKEARDDRLKAATKGEQS